MNKKEPKTIFAIIDTEDKFLGYFKDLKSVNSYLERECLEEVIILEIITIIDASYPPEPELELTNIKLSSKL